MAAATATVPAVNLQLKELQIWFTNNAKLPEKVDPLVLHRFLKCMAYDMEKTKSLIELNYNLRNKSAHIFLDRNMDDEATARGLLASDLLIMPGVTPERHKLLLFRMADMDPLSRNPVEESKIFFMMADARFTMPDVASGEAAAIDDAQIADGDVQIVDINGYTMRHVARVSIFVLRVYMKFLQEAYPSRLRAMHVINCPAFLDRLVAIMKPFIREEVYQLINFHTEGLESLYKCVPRDMLPLEYGGQAGTIAEIKQHWLDRLRQQSAYLSDEKYWKITEPSKSSWSWF